MRELSHLDSEGRARIVDVGEKAVTDRRAVARVEVANVVLVEKTGGRSDWRREG